MNPNSRILKQFAFLISILLLSLFACVDKIDFDVPRGLSESIAINGRLIKDGNSARVRVTVSNIFDFSNDGRRPVTVREPKLVDDRGNSLILPRVDLSDYEAVINPGDPLQLEFGRTYSLEVELFDGRRYKSTPERLLPSPEVEEFGWSLVDQSVLNGQGQVEIDKRLALDVTTALQVDSEKPGLLWEFERTYKITDFSTLQRQCYVPENPNASRVIIAEGDDFDANALEDFELLRLPLDRRLSEGSLFELKQYSLTPTAAKYWKSADLLLSKTGNMFDAPSSRIGSNFINQADSTDVAYGFFFVTEVKTSFLKLDSTDISGINRFCDGSGVTAENPCPFGCCDCEEIQNASLEIPENWVQ